MSTTIVICADGTGNTFDRKTSNVTMLLRYLDLDPPPDASDRQVAVYDQGIGTADRTTQAEAYRETLTDKDALTILEVKKAGSLFGRARGMLTGYGLKENVGQMYAALAERYVGPDETPVFMFGFSRGAFTVRALAGVLHRCGLPPEGANAADHFAAAWDLYVPQPREPEPLMPPPEAARFKGEGRDCEIHFLGLWDTVKSYGGVVPVMLPHLRHNPIVRHVRHALALNEGRAWFDATTWGRLDGDLLEGAAMERVPDPDRALIMEQDILEVWFRGNHSDIGGGNPENPTPEIALRWMLGEATSLKRHPLRLNVAGSHRLRGPDPEPVPGPVRPLGWRVLDWLRFSEIDNSGVYPRRTRATPRGFRDLAKVVRKGRIAVHRSAAATFDRARITRAHANVQMIQIDSVPTVTSPTEVDA